MNKAELIPLFEAERPNMQAPASPASRAAALTSCGGGATKPAPQTFQEAIKAVAQFETGSVESRRGLQTALRQIAWSITLIQARASGACLDPDKTALDLTHIAFDIPAINRAWEGLRYGLAGFASDKSYRNARWALRRISRELGMVVPHRAPSLPAQHQYEPFLAAANAFEQASARRFAAYLVDQGLSPEAVTDADLARYSDFLRCEMIGVQIAPMLRRIVRLWRCAAQAHPSWPQTPLTRPGPARPTTLPFSAYPLSLQSEIADLHRRMTGPYEGGPFNPRCHRRPLRPATAQLRLGALRLILTTYVALGHAPQSLTSLRMLLAPDTLQAILQAIWERGQARWQATPAAERAPHWNGNTNQLDAAGMTVLMLVHKFPPPPERLRSIQALVKKVRRPQMTAMSRKNQRRLEQFLDPVKLGLLLNLPQSLMTEALQRRAGEPAEAARLARTAVFFAIELRIPLRMKNLHTCRLGHNLRFASPQSPTALLSFQASEMKNHSDIAFYVGPRLCQYLRTYITHFRPFFAATVPDDSTEQWLFPAGDGKSGPLSSSQVRNLITTTMAERVGVVFHPHLFRALAVQISLEHRPDALEHCRQLLGDKTLQTVLTHYAPIRTKAAAEHQDALVNAEADRLAALAAPRGRVRRRAGGRS